MGVFLSENPCDRISDPKKYIQKIQFFATDFCLYIYGFTSIFNPCLSNLKKKSLILPPYFGLNFPMNLFFFH